MANNEDKKLNVEDIRRKLPQFRILVIGPANAGKTTIAKKMCKTDEKPVIWNGRRRDLDPSTMGGPSQDRGEHDVENEIRYLSNPGFVFHDSRGFESGGTDELEKVLKFIKERATKQHLYERLHAIWYCVPMDSCRPLCAAERKFFENGTGDVPVILILTKYDAFISEDYQRLRKEGKSITDARAKAPAQADTRFKTEYLQHLALNSMLHKPKATVRLSNLHKPDTGCGELTEVTAKAVDNETLCHWFISLQHDRIELRYKNCIKRALEPVLKGKIVVTGESASKIVESILDDFLDTIIHGIVQKVYVGGGDERGEFVGYLQDEVGVRGGDRGGGRDRDARELMPILKPAALDFAPSQPPLLAALTITIAMTIVIGNALSSYHSATVGLDKDGLKSRVEESLKTYHAQRSNLVTVIEEAFKDECWAVDRTNGAQSSEEVHLDSEKLCHRVYDIVMQYRLDKPQSDAEQSNANRQAVEPHRSGNLAPELPSLDEGGGKTTENADKGQERGAQGSQAANMGPSPDDGQNSAGVAEVKGSTDRAPGNSQDEGRAVGHKQNGKRKKMGNWFRQLFKPE